MTSVVSLYETTEICATNLPNRENDEMTWLTPPIVVPFLLVCLIALRVMYYGHL